MILTARLIEEFMKGARALVPLDDARRPFILQEMNLIEDVLFCDHENATLCNDLFLSLNCDVTERAKYYCLTHMQNLLRSNEKEKTQEATA